MIKALLAVVLAVGATVLAPLGVLWSCSCEEGDDSVCPAVVVMRYGFAAAAVLSLAMSAVTFIASRSLRYAAIIFFLQMLVSDWFLSTLVASFMCASGTTAIVKFQFAAPYAAVQFLALLHTLCIIRGKIMPLAYRSVFAVAYSVSTTCGALLFLFSPAVALIPQQEVALLPVALLGVLSLVGVRQSWTSPRPLRQWEVVHISLKDVFGATAEGRDHNEALDRGDHEGLLETVEVKSYGMPSQPTKPNGTGHSKTLPPQLMRPGVPLDAVVRRVTVQEFIATQPNSPSDEAFHRKLCHLCAVEATSQPPHVSFQPVESSGILTVAQITDPHLGSFLTTESLRSICSTVAALCPDLVLLTGDFFTAEAHEEEHALSLALEPLKGLRVVACFGNHDLESEHVTLLVERAIKSIGGSLLVDGSIRMATHCGNVEVIGLNYYRPFAVREKFQTYFDAYSPPARGRSEADNHSPSRPQRTGVDSTASLCWWAPPIGVLWPHTRRPHWAIQPRFSSCHPVAAYRTQGQWALAQRCRKWWRGVHPPRTRRQEPNVAGYCAPWRSQRRLYSESHCDAR